MKCNSTCESHACTHRTLIMVVKLMSKTGLLDVFVKIRYMNYLIQLNNQLLVIFYYRCIIIIITLLLVICMFKSS